MGTLGRESRTIDLRLATRKAQPASAIFSVNLLWPKNAKSIIICYVRAGIIAVALVLSCVGVYCHAESQEPPAGTESRPAEPYDTSPVVIIQPEQETKPQPKKERMLTEEEAYELVWNLPEIRKEIEKILNDGGVPLATVATRPAPARQSGEENSFYIVRFQGVQAKSVFIELLFSVDAFSGQIRVYDSYTGSLISLEDWRRRK
jgi:hypothetical protein